MQEDRRKIYLNVEGKVRTVINLYANYHLRIKGNEDILCHMKNQIICLSQFLSEGITNFKKKEIDSRNNQLAVRSNDFQKVSQHWF